MLRHDNGCTELLNKKFLFRSARTYCTTVIHPPTRAKNLDQLYSCMNHHKTTTNLSDIVWCKSGGVWSMSGGVWSMSGGVLWCLVVSGECLTMLICKGWYDLSWCIWADNISHQLHTTSSDHYPKLAQIQLDFWTKHRDKVNVLKLSLPNWIN